MSKLVGYRAEQIPEIWPSVLPHIKRALDRNSNYSLAEVYEGLCSALMQLWTWENGEVTAAMVTAIQNSDNTRYCLFLALGGSGMSEWERHLPIVERWARDEGCSEMRIYGRPGWSRRFPGFKAEYVKMVRPL